MAESGGPVDPIDATRGFLSRWSRRKLEQKGEASVPVAPDAAAAQPGSEAQAAASAVGSVPDPAQSVPVLPPIESLTATSDFSPFMHPAVAPALRRAALKKLFADPHFNVMDGLDTYIDDYSIEDPIPEELMKKLYQARQHVFSSEQNAALDAEDEAARAAADPARAGIEANEAKEANQANQLNEANHDPGKA